MAYSVAGRVEQVETSITVEVKGLVLAKFEAFSFRIKINFAESATFPGLLVDWSFLVRRVAGDKSAFEPGSNYQVCRCWKGGRVARMILYDVRVWLRDILLTRGLTKCQCDLQTDE